MLVKMTQTGYVVVISISLQKINKIITPYVVLSLWLALSQ